MNNKKPIFWLWLFLLSGCATTYNVESEYVSGFDFLHKKKFAIALAANPHPVKKTPVSVELEKEIISQLEAKSFVSASFEDADILVSYFIADKQAQSVEVFQAPNVSYNNENCSYCASVPAPTRSNAQQKDFRLVDYAGSNLVVYIVDAQTRVLIWRGRADAKFSGDTLKQLNEQQRVKLINKSVTGILNHYPPSRKSQRIEKFKGGNEWW
ncbi:MAG: DUF4136 domain-containing protein [Gammaproteobacteria bacterium]|nr:DUF4136 domain-containing protein [Gammaproteobacteria bacterium]